MLLMFQLVTTGKSELVWRFNLENLVFLRHGGFYLSLGFKSNTGQSRQAAQMSEKSKGIILLTWTQLFIDYGVAFVL